MPLSRVYFLSSVLLKGTLGFFGFVVTVLVAHRMLFEQRPAASHLTEYYLWMAVGGVVGGLIAAIGAPLAFNAVSEFPLLIAVGFACRPDTLRHVADANPQSWTRIFG